MPFGNPFRCFTCGQAGHLKANCPSRNTPAPTPAGPAGWCGTCDPRTRHIDHGGYLSRCHYCHPKRSDGLAQHVNCAACGNTKYTWDQSPCGDHRPLAYQGELVFAALL